MMLPLRSIWSGLIKKDIINYISGKKWWTRVFFDLIDRAKFNRKVLFNESPHTSRKSLKDFKVDLAKLLIGNFRSRRKRGRSSLDNQQARFV